MRFLLLILTLLSICHVSAVELVDGYARATAPGQKVAAAYVWLQNPGETRQLVRVASERAGAMEIHGHRQREGVWQMYPIQRLEISAGSDLKMASGGIHLMLFRLVSPLAEGERLPVTLIFDDDSQVSAELPIVSPLTEVPF